MLNDTEADDDVEARRHDREAPDVGLADEIAWGASAVRVVRFDGDRQVRSKHARAGRQQDLGKSTRAAAGLEHRLVAHDAEVSTETPR
jgi:hypothetical protein